MTGNALRISALVGVAAVASCESYGDYSSLRVPDDATTSSTGGSGNANTGGTSTGNGGLIDSGVGTGGLKSTGGAGGLAGGDAGDASMDVSSKSDAQSESGSGGSGSGGSSSGGAAGASGGGGGSAPDATPLGDIVDGGKLVAATPLSTCGFLDQKVFFDGGASHDVRTIDFGCSDVTQDFVFRTPPVVVAPGNWQYVATGNPHVVQTGNAQSFPVRGAQSVLEGTHGIYQSQVFRDGKVTARLWSADDDIGCLIARYQDEVHYYRLCMSGAGQYLWVLGRITVNRFVELQRGTVPAVVGYPGHQLGLEFVGQTIRVFMDGQVVFGPFDDPGGYSFGLVGFEAIVLQDANFDDLTIESY